LALAVGLLTEASDQSDGLTGWPCRGTQGGRPVFFGKPWAGVGTNHRRSLRSKVWNATCRNRAAGHRTARWGMDLPAARDILQRAKRRQSTGEAFVPMAHGKVLAFCCKERSILLTPPFRKSEWWQERLLVRVGEPRSSGHHPRAAFSRTSPTTSPPPVVGCGISLSWIRPPRHHEGQFQNRWPSPV